MLRPVLFAAFTLGWTFSAVARADDAVIRVPVAVGEGVDEKEALHHAFADAVRQVMKVYVLAEKTLNTEGDVVKEVSTFSNGYIAWYEQVRLPDSPAGRKRVQIAADVVRGKLERRLLKEGVKPPAGGQAGFDATGVYAREVTQTMRKEEETKLLKQLLSRAPGYSELARTIKVDSSEEPVKTADGRYRAKVYYTVELDFDRYLAHNRWLHQVLQHAKADYLGSSSSAGKSDLAERNLKPGRTGKFEEEVHMPCFDLDQGCVVRLGTGGHGFLSSDKVWRKLQSKENEVRPNSVHGGLAIQTGYQIIREPNLIKTMWLDTGTMKEREIHNAKDGEAKTEWELYQFDPAALDAALATYGSATDQRGRRIVVEAVAADGSVIARQEGVSLHRMSPFSSAVVGRVEYEHDALRESLAHFALLSPFRANDNIANARKEKLHPWRDNLRPLNVCGDLYLFQGQSLDFELSLDQLREVKGFRGTFEDIPDAPKPTPAIPSTSEIPLHHYLGAGGLIAVVVVVALLALTHLTNTSRTQVGHRGLMRCGGLIVMALVCAGAFSCCGM